MISTKNKGQLDIVPLLAIADPKIIAESLIHETANGEKEIFEALARLLECNRNEKGQNISAIVATATLPVNRQPNYLFDETELARAIFSNLSAKQIKVLESYNTTQLQNPEPDAETVLIREVFGVPEILKPNEGNSHLAAFLRLGANFASNNDLEVPETKPQIEAVQGSTMALCMLSMCLKKGFLPLMRHDGSHINTGFSTTVKGEIYNQTHDFATNSVAQYGVVPNLAEQRLNRRVIYSFFGLPQKLQGLQRDWKEFVSQALETWRTFFVENPEYAERWGLKDFLNSEMRMVKPDGSAIISEQTGEQQIPVIDYTDLAVLRHLSPKLEQLLTDEEVHGSMPYELLYKHMLESIELLSIEYILRDGKAPVLINGVYDACATHNEVRYGNLRSPSLAHLSSVEPHELFEREDTCMERERAVKKLSGKWCGYIVECGQGADKPMWVTEKPPCLAFLYSEALTVHRITLPAKSIESAKRAGSFFGGVGYLRKQQRLFERFPPALPARKYISGESFRYLGRQYTLKIESSIVNKLKLERGRLIVYTTRTDPRHIKELVDAWYRMKATAIFAERVAFCQKLIAKANIRYEARISLRIMKTRWGTCTKNQKITLNPELVATHKECIDYVIVHELCHLKEHNHGPSFFKLLSLRYA